MGLLDELRLPANNDSEKKEKCRYVMDKCKSYYNDLINAKQAVVSYIIRMEHTQDSLEYAKKQYDKAKSELTDNIEDEEYKGELLKALDDSMDECDDLKKILAEKTSKLEEINTKLAQYLTRVVNINSQADNMS